MHRESNQREVYFSARGAASPHQLPNTRRRIEPLIRRRGALDGIDLLTKTTMKSRHIQHEHNALAVAALLLDLEDVGEGVFSVGLHWFPEVTAEGSYNLDSVEVERITGHLPGGAANGVSLRKPSRWLYR